MTLHNEGNYINDDPEHNVLAATITQIAPFCTEQDWLKRDRDKNMDIHKRYFQISFIEWISESVLKIQLTISQRCFW